MITCQSFNVGGYGEGDDNSIDREKIKVVVNLVVKKPEVSEGHRDQEELLESSEHADEETANFHKVQLPKVDKEKRRKKEMSSKPEVSELSELEVLGKPVKTISELPDLKVDKENRRRKKMSLRPEMSEPPDLKDDKEKRRKKEMSSKPEVSELSELEVLGKPVKTISELPDVKVDEENRRRTLRCL